jgi:hypothetical protein
MRAGLVFAVLVGSWVSFAIVYFGSAIPHSAVEKFQRTSPEVYFEHAWAHPGEVLIPFGQGMWRSICAWSAFLAGVIALTRRDSTLLLLALFTCLHLLLFALFLRPFVEHSWQLYPTVLGFVVFAAAGLSWFSRRANNRLARAGAGILLCCLIVGIAVRSVRASTELPDAYWTGARDSVYQDVALFLRNHLRVDEEFASVEVGTISYYSERTAYDLGGLITDLRTDAMARHPVRLLVLDKRYLYTAPPWVPLRVFSKGEFDAYVYEMPMPRQRQNTRVHDRELEAVARSSTVTTEF